MELSLNPAWSIRGHNPLVLSSETSTLSIKLLPGQLAMVLELLQGWRHGAQPDLEDLRNELVSRGALRPVAISPSPGQDRQVQYWRAFTDDAGSAVSRLRAATVAIAGVGGVGSVALQHLVGAGVCNFRLLDADIVDASNLNRQFIYSASAVGALKVEEARLYVTKRESCGDVSVLAESWNPESSDQRRLLFRGVDFVLAAVDRPSIDSSMQILDSAWAAGVPAVLATVGLDRSLVSQVFDPSVSSNSPREALRVNPAIPRAPFLASHGPSNTIPATIAADQILHHIAGITGRVDFQRPLVILRSPDGAPTSTRVDQVQL
ncbi:ThiF family adenylyltransferase [Diaminobutyricibacter tongyongensis]|uniref:ThiF family adenylyltransferase n=1 Tax=Leifsonia tongyongensis TaxID=1268043 RepID=A0A6L9XU95_9MICO|nr:ThiF family adenylyltransferase [Diaminobutyricibacter tongyongensis]NEN04588.1 ThiF family adenylyltransferase [Diaminobutyricibacter tongyongensis]